MKIRWKTITRAFTISEECFLGKWNVGSIIWDVLSPDREEKKWKANCRLPGIKYFLESFKEAREAKDKVEKTISYWIEQSTILE